MFYRMSNGTGFEGHICLKESSYSSLLQFSTLPDKTFPTFKEAKRAYGGCLALDISSENEMFWGVFPPVYAFLYGNPLEYFDDYGKQPKFWTKNSVTAMNWDLFCLSYYSFLCAEDNFKSHTWKALGSILYILAQDPELVRTMLSRRGVSSFSFVSEFWDTVSNGLSKKILRLLTEETCHDAFVALKEVQGILTKETYFELEQKCCGFFDKIARARIDEANDKTYTAWELVNFDIENLFFYKDYFGLQASIGSTKQYVNEVAFDLLRRKADKILAAGSPIEADNVYVATLRFAQTNCEKEKILTKRSEIADRVNEAREAEALRKAVAQLEQEKERKKQRRYDLLVESTAKIAAVIFLLSIPCSIVFGIMALVGVWDFSKIAFIVSACIAIAFIIPLALDDVKKRRR